MRVAGRTAGFAHVSCLAEQAKILVAEAWENNLDDKVKIERFQLWNTCSLCEQKYHGVVQCALGWACWKTYLGLPETETAQAHAMQYLGNGLSAAEHYEDALSVREAMLSIMRRIGADENVILCVQGNLAETYRSLGREQHALRMLQDVYSGELKLYGAQHEQTLISANNYAATLTKLERFKESRSLLRRTIPVAQRVFGENQRATLKMQRSYAAALYLDANATLNDLREAVTTLDETVRIARRVLGGAHPTARSMEISLQEARAALSARETGGRVLFTRA